MPNTGNIQMDAMATKQLHLLFALETGIRISPSHFGKAFKVEAAQRPTIVRVCALLPPRVGRSWTQASAWHARLCCSLTPNYHTQAFRKKKDVSSQCVDCAFLRARLAEALHGGDKSQIASMRANLTAHFEFVRAEKRFIADEHAAAIEDGASTALVYLDFMDQYSTQMPNMPAHLQNLITEESRLKVKVLGVLWAAQGGNDNEAFCVPEWVTKTGNLLASCLLASIHNRFDKRGGDMPQRLFIHVDGGSENWNVDVFAVGAYLASARVFREVVVSRLPVGHTHGKVDQFFSTISKGLHGDDSKDTGRKSFTPQQWTKTVESCFLKQKPAVVWVNSAWAFDDLFAPVLARLKNYGATRQWTHGGDACLWLEEKSQHHFRHVVFRVAPGDVLATAHFARSAVEAKAGKYYPLRQDGTHSGLSDSGAALFNSDSLDELPIFEPTLQRFIPSDGKYANKLPHLMDLIDAMSLLEGVPHDVRQHWAAFLRVRPCVLMSNPLGDPKSWRRTPQAPSVEQAPPGLLGRRLLDGFDPLVTSTRTADDVAEDLRQLLARHFPAAKFDVRYDKLAMGSMAIALAQPLAQGEHEHAFTIPVKGRDSPRLELLRVDGMFRKGNAPWVQWAYFRWKGRHMGLHKFVPLMDGNAQRRQPHFYQDPGSPTNGKRCEILMVWSPPSPVEGDFMLPAEKLCDLQYWYDLPLCLHLHPY